MRTKVAVGLAVVAMCLSAQSANAGVYADDMSKCLVKSTTDDDQLTFIKWVFAAMSVHPAIAPSSRLTSEDREKANAAAGQLMVKLVTQSCRAESVAALKYEGSNALESAFGVFGEVAMGGIMRDPAVNASLESLATAFASDEMQQVMVEAGMAAPGKK